MAINQQGVVDSIESDVVVEASDLRVSFGMERGRSVVLDDVSMDIRRGEILGIVGESGSGKSMFASALLDAVVDPGHLSGELRYHPPDGEPVDVLELDKGDLRQFRWEEISMVFQGAMSSFNPVRKIKTHFVDTLIAHDYSVDEYMARAKDVLRDLYLDPDRVLESYPHELSGGMRQRTLIALSLLLEPEVLVMDEPTAALDLLMQRSIIGLLEELQEKYDLTIVFITHDLPLIAGLTDRVAVMYAFEFVEVGTTNDILTNPVHPYTRALLRSTPNLDSPLSHMKPIEGKSPDPVNIPQGCSFHTRCPLAQEECEVNDPDYYDVSERHDVKCHFWEDAADAIPMAIEVDEDYQEVELPPTRAPGEQDAVVELDGVDVHFEQSRSGLFQFGESDLVRAVDDVSLDLGEEDVLVVLGESGCGKTTLGKTAIGIQEPTAGSVEYRDQDVWNAKRRLGDIQIPFEEIRHSLQIIHQDPGSALNPHRRVRSSLADPLRRWAPDLSSEDRLQRILGMLEYVGMSPPEDYVQRYPHQLSGGEQQRVALIRAMLAEPEVIMADEAVSALDVSLRIEMMDLMIELQEEFGTSYVFISHNLSNARYIAGKTGGKIAVMYLGEIVEIGSPEALIENPTHPYTQALHWATPKLNPALATEDEDRPLRRIDVPDPSDPPSGCRFHTRCPKARTVCSEVSPELVDADDDRIHDAACFRAYENHEYWESEPIDDRSDAEPEDDG